MPALGKSGTSRIRVLRSVMNGDDPYCCTRAPCGSRCVTHAVQESCTIANGADMPLETSYTTLRSNLASVLDQVVDQQDTVIVRRKGARDVALVHASELARLIATA